MGDSGWKHTTIARCPKINASHVERQWREVPEQLDPHVAL
jgi:hypothetical protein